MERLLAGRLIGERRPPDFLQVQKQLFEVDVGCVELVDHDHAAQTAFLGDVHHAARQKLDALGGVDDGADGLTASSADIS